jgi:hypothetical protein
MMKTKILMCLTLLAGVLACSSNPNKAEKIETKMDKKSKISGDSEVGVKDGNMVVQRKTLMSEELRDLQYEVYGLEDRVYGNSKYGSTGLYGSLKDCRRQLSDKTNGGSGKLMWTEPIDRVTDKEDEFNIGIDEDEKVVGVTEEFIKDRLKRFREYKRILQKRTEEYEDKLDICKAELKTRKHDAQRQSNESDT